MRKVITGQFCLVNLGNGISNGMIQSICGFPASVFMQDTHDPILGCLRFHPLNLSDAEV